MWLIDHRRWRAAAASARVLLRMAVVPPLLLTRAPTAADARPALPPAAALSFRFPTFRLPLLPPPPATTAGAVAVAPTAATNDDEAEVSGGPSALFSLEPGGGCGCSCGGSSSGRIESVL